ncbi:MAG: hydrogenase 4 subunit B [Methylococcales bacterium]|nr:hydrogenase 4 subunit B [Methylococcales bacterium]
MILTLAYGAILLSLASACFALLQTRFTAMVFLLLGLSGALAIAAGIGELLDQTVLVDNLKLGLPWQTWKIRFDGLSAFFFLIIGIAVFAVSFYAPHYTHHEQKNPASFAVLSLFTGLFIAGMMLVLLADDAFMFMIAWELMSVASYFLVAFQHENSANRIAAFLYLLMAEVGALLIILAFGVVASFADGFTFDELRASQISTTWMSIAFVLALMGFGMKAGLVPIHVWLPEAHPVAPSHISALMSGVMLKVALYGLIRFCFDLLPEVHWQWGVVLLIVGTVSALSGILYAMMQQNLKRLLAYSSVENIGIIVMVLGLSMIFLANNHKELAALGLLAALFHAFNHALFKNLLFLGAGMIHHQTHELNIDMLGGLIKRMPKTSVIFLIGCMSISSLPLFNGFVSEWLALQTALQVGVLDNGVLRSLIPVSAAALALTAALAAACFVKVFGLIFLGVPRSRHAEKAKEIDNIGMLAAPAMLAGLCFFFGIFPSVILDLLGGVTNHILDAALPQTSVLTPLWLAPVSMQQASYSPLLILVSVLITALILFLALHGKGATKARIAPTWDCGFGALSPRMQYTSSAFTMPLRRIFATVFLIDEKIEKTMRENTKLNVADVRYSLHIQDHSWVHVYQPIERGVNRVAKQVGRIQTGNIRTYIGYSLATLILLLWVVSL